MRESKMAGLGGGGALTVVVRVVVVDFTSLYPSIMVA